MGGKSTLRTRQKGKKAPTLAGLKKKAWKLLSEVIRREAANPDGTVQCYTCWNNWHWKQHIQAGHAIPGRNGAVLLDEDVIRPQCVQCNIWMRGNYPFFTTRLIKEKGMEWWESKLLSAKQVKKWTRGELEAKCEEYRTRLAALGP